MKDRYRGHREPGSSVKVISVDGRLLRVELWLAKHHCGHKAMAMKRAAILKVEFPDPCEVIVSTF